MRRIEIPEALADQLDALAARLATLNGEAFDVSRDALIKGALTRGLQSISNETHQREHAACAHPPHAWYQHPHDDPEEVFCALCHGQVPRSVVVLARKAAAE